MGRRRCVSAALITLLTVLATGWASAGNSCDLSGNSTDGLAIVSATLPPLKYEVGYPQWFSYAYNRKGGVGLTDKMMGLDRGHLFTKVTSDFTGVFGKLFILRLPAGTYQFKYWVAGVGLEKEQPMGISPLTFSVTPGRAVYLGGFDPTVTEGKNVFHQTVARSWVLVRDDHSRDLAVLLKECPGFDLNLLDLSVMDTSPWLPPHKPDPIR